MCGDWLNKEKTNVKGSRDVIIIFYSIINTCSIAKVSNKNCTCKSSLSNVNMSSPTLTIKLLYDFLLSINIKLTYLHHFSVFY